jgi:hypothetical protein
LLIKDNTMNTLPSENVFFEETCDNGVRLTVADLSKKIAGDRWLVKIICNASIARGKIDSWFSRKESVETAVDNVEGNAAWRSVKQLVRQRNFVDGEERIEVRNELLRQLKTTVFPYLKSDSFVDRLLETSVHRENSVTKEEADGNPYADLDQDDGPTDFSFLFKQ